MLCKAEKRISALEKQIWGSYPVCNRERYEEGKYEQVMERWRIDWEGPEASSWILREIRKNGRGNLWMDMGENLINRRKKYSPDGKGTLYSK